MDAERLQKLLAQAGYGSRRACEEIITQGRVTVDGRIAQLGERADPETQRILVDGAPLPRPQSYVYIMVNKPRGYLSTTSDPHGRRTVLDLVTSAKLGPARLYPVGRLDNDSEGLILLTNDGMLTQRLTHPRYEHPRVYRALIKGEPDAEVLDRWRRGITLDGRLTGFDKVSQENPDHGFTWLTVTVHEGRNHLVRRIINSLGFQVERLVRVEMGPLKLGSLSIGHYRSLTNSEIQALQREVGTGSPQAPKKRAGTSRPARAGRRRPGSKSSSK